MKGHLMAFYLHCIIKSITAILSLVASMLSSVAKTLSYAIIHIFRLHICIYWAFFILKFLSPESISFSQKDFRHSDCGSMPMNCYVMLCCVVRSIDRKTQKQWIAEKQTNYLDIGWMIVTKTSISNSMLETIKCTIFSNNVATMCRALENNQNTHLKF